MRTLATALMLLAAPALAGFDAATQKTLDEATYVYIQSERKSGDLGSPAEIWFHVEEGAVYVGTRPTSWRVRRIKAGRTRARVAIGKADGPAFDAVGALINDAALAKRLMDAFATKYPDGWKRHEEGFRTGFTNGDRVLVRYTPK